jgi:hypothetical protein
MALPSLADTEEYVNALYFGPGGSGKSTDAAHMAKLSGHVVAIDCESGLKKRPLRRMGVPVENIHPYPVSNFDAMNKLTGQMEAKLIKEAEQLAAGDLDPADRLVGIIIDSFTELQKRFIEDIVDTRNAKRAATMIVDPFEVDIKEQGKMTEMCRRVARRLRDLPCHVAFVCLDKREVDNDAGGVFYRPALTPAFSTDLIGYVDAVFCTRQEDTEDGDLSRFVASTVPTGRFRGKDRYGVFPSTFVNPTFDRVVQYVNEDGDVPGDPYQEAYRARTNANAAISST